MIWIKSKGAYCTSDWVVLVCARALHAERGPNTCSQDLTFDRCILLNHRLAGRFVGILNCMTWPKSQVDNSGIEAQGLALIHAEQCHCAVHFCGLGFTRGRTGGVPRTSLDFRACLHVIALLQIWSFSFLFLSHRVLASSRLSPAR